MSYAYRAYGLTFSSDSPIPGLCLETPSRVPDVIVELSPDPPMWVHQACNLPTSVRRGKGESTEIIDPPCKLTAFGAGEFLELAYADGARFVTDSAASRLWGTCPDPLTIEDLAVYLRGPVSGFLLQRRGVSALHASAVCLAEHAVVLCGHSEAGKSTTAAALAMRGVPVLCDDIAAFAHQQDSFYVESAYPRICLWPSAVRDLFGAPDALPRLTPTWEKCFLPLDGATAVFEAQRRPLAVIYILAQRNELHAPRIVEIAPREALLELLRNTYMNWFLDRKQRAAEFHTLSELVARVPVRRIVPHLHSSRVDQLCNLIVTDAMALINSRQSAVALPVQ
jgi:hypothetical protein